MRLKTQSITFALALVAATAQAGVTITIRHHNGLQDSKSYSSDDPTVFLAYGDEAEVVYDDRKTTRPIIYGPYHGRISNYKGDVNHGGVEDARHAHSSARGGEKNGNNASVQTALPLPMGAEPWDIDIEADGIQCYFKVPVKIYRSGNNIDTDVVIASGTRNITQSMYKIAIKSGEQVADWPKDTELPLDNKGFSISERNSDGSSTFIGTLTIKRISGGEASDFRKSGCEAQAQRIDNAKTAPKAP